MGELLMIVMITCYNMDLFIWNSPNWIIYWLIKQENRSKVPYSKRVVTGVVTGGITVEVQMVQLTSVM